MILEVRFDNHIPQPKLMVSRPIVRNPSIGPDVGLAPANFRLPVSVELFDNPQRAVGHVCRALSCCPRQIKGDSAQLFLLLSPQLMTRAIRHSALLSGIFAVLATSWRPDESPHLPSIIFASVAPGRSLLMMRDDFRESSESIPPFGKAKDRYRSGPGCA